MKQLKPEIKDWLDRHYEELFNAIALQNITQYHKSRLESLMENFKEKFKRPLTRRILELYGK